MEEGMHLHLPSQIEIVRGYLTKSGIATPQPMKNIVDDGAAQEMINTVGDKDIQHHDTDIQQCYGCIYI